MDKNKNCQNDSENDLSEHTDQTVESKDSNSNGRRRVLQTLVAGGVVSSASMVPAKWSRPVVDSVMLPAHGQSSAQMLVAGAATVIANNTGPDNQSSEGLATRVLEMFVEPAHAIAAQPSVCSSLVGKCLTFVFTGGAGGPVSGSISGVPSGNGTLVGTSLPPGFMIGPFEVAGTFTPDFTSGGGRIVNCTLIDWQSGRGCSTAPVSEETTTTTTTTGFPTTTDFPTTTVFPTTTRSPDV